MARAFPLPRTTPESHGVSARAIGSFVRALDMEITDVHSVMVLRRGDVIAEAWWEPFAPTTPHSLFSVSKSFTSTAIGLAISEGRLGLDDRVVDLLPDDAPEVGSERLDRMRVRHLLTMTTGHSVDAMAALNPAAPNWAELVLAQPVDFEPGAHFLYNSGATYLLSAILARVTGERLLDYLTPRLFAPLGIVGATWESCPRGIDVGGWGLAVTTEDIAAFGQLVLQCGDWNGSNLVPAAWFDEATSWQVSNAHHDGGPDWQHGYGFQFWRCRNGAFRGDGAFGQFCVILPQHDVVLAMTGATTEMQAVLDVVWREFLPALTVNTPLSPDETAQRQLDELTRSLAISAVGGSPDSARSVAVNGAWFGLEENVLGMVAVSLAFDSSSATITFRIGEDSHPISCGWSDWKPGTAPALGDGRGPIAASAAWVSDDELRADVLFVETPFATRIDVRFDTTDAVSLVITQNVSFESTDIAILRGRRNQ